MPLTLPNSNIVMPGHGRIEAYRSIGSILGSGGTAYSIIPIGDESHESPTHTTVTTVGAGAGNGLVFTYSEARTAFDAPTKYRHNQIWTPDVPFNSTDESGAAPDADYWSLGDGADDSPFSIGAWVTFRATSTGIDDAIFSKYSTNIKEWVLMKGFNSNKLLLLIYDDVANVFASVNSTTVMALDKWVFAVGTYDGTGGTTAGDGMKLYINGVLQLVDTVNNASYVAMTNYSSQPKIGVYFNTGAFHNGRIAGGPVGPFFTRQELSASQIARLYRIGRGSLQ